MPVGPIGTLPPLAPLTPTSRPEASGPAGSGFAQVLGGMLAQNTQATATADAAVADLATGQAQDLHTVSMAVAQADLSFRLILELRNRLTEAYQEVQRMQV
jgi:flagellar hook-basal body complex protein FliE